MIGTEAEAREVVDFYMSGEHRSAKFPLIGSGAFRVVYSSPSGMLYKIGTQHVNLSEIENHDLHANRLPEPFRIPPMTYYDFGGEVMDSWGEVITAIAVPRVMGEHPHECYDYFGYTCMDCEDRDENGVCEKDQEFHNNRFLIKSLTGLTDMHIFNIIIGEDGFWYLIDLGM